MNMGDERKGKVVLPFYSSRFADRPHQLVVTNSIDDHAESAKEATSDYSGFMVSQTSM